MRERKIMKLLLKIKNGTPPQRKTAMRQISDKAKELGADSLFNQILPLLMSPTLEVRWKEIRTICSGGLTSCHVTSCWLCYRTKSATCW